MVIFCLNKYLKNNILFSLNFKETTNLGRHLVFAQCKIPIISDYSISSSNFINNKKNGLLAYDTDDWYQNLKYLIENKKNLNKLALNYLQIGEKIFLMRS